MAGGAGVRLWPFSREIYPKQFIDFLADNISLLRLTFDRYSKIFPINHIFVVTNEEYAHIVKKQLPEISIDQILLEPVKKNTAPCIAYAAYRIRSINPESTMVIAPSDHLIDKEEELFKVIQQGVDFVKKTDALVSLGIQPDRPDTSYGYIQRCDDLYGDFTKVKTFTEKPSLEMAKLFVESGEFYWNSGIFIWRTETIIKALDNFLPDITARFDLGKHKFGTEEENLFIKENYPYLPAISIDYGVMEKADNVFMLGVDIGWEDVESWYAIEDLVDKDESGNALIGGDSLLYECKDNFVAIRNPNKLVVLQGLEDYVIIDTDNALMICKRDKLDRIKQFTADAKLKFGEEYI